MIIYIKEIIGTDLAVSVEDGDVVFNKIVSCLKKSQDVELDFSGLDLITTAFLNNAFGKLYSEFMAEELNKHIKIKNIRQGDLEKLIDVKERVTNKNSINFKSALVEELGEDE